LSARFTTALRVALFGLAALLLRRELLGLDIPRVVGDLKALGWSRVALAIAGTTASFLALGAIELGALRCSGIGVRRIGTRRAMVTGFVAHAFSQSLGFGVLTQAAVRLRSYTPLQVDTRTIARVSAVVLFAVTLGLLAVGSAALLMLQPDLRVASIAIPARLLGLAMTALLVAGLAWSVVASRRGGASVPSPTMVFSLAALSAVDWLLAGSVLFVLLPPGGAFAFGPFLGAYVVAQLVAVVSHVPGGAGVFEATLLALLALHATPDAQGFLVAALVAYRACYYLLPLAAALLVAAPTVARRPLPASA
jgi:phosphatidylglycerol lysyltransferase